VRSDRDSLGFTAPQPEHVLELGNQRSAITSRPPCHAVLYVNCRRNSPNPASDLEANARALLGEANACASSLDRAEKALDRANENNTPEWLSYLDAGYMAARFAHCLRDSGDLPNARTFAMQASTMSGDLCRTRALNLNLLATTYIESDPAQACDLANQVLTVSTGIHSGRVAGYLGGLRDQLRSEHPDNAQVREFSERTHELLGA